MPREFTREQRCVSVIGKHSGNRRLLGGQSAANVEEIFAMAPGQDAGGGWPAAARCGVSDVEQHSLVREPVDVRRLDDRMIHEAIEGPAEVVGLCHQMSNLSTWLEQTPARSSWRLTAASSPAMFGLCASARGLS